MPEIDFQQGTSNSVKLSRLLAGNPLGYRHQQADAISARTPQGNSRQADEPHPKTLRKPVTTMSQQGF
jgi:hypothetical protein